MTRKQIAEQLLVYPKETRRSQIESWLNSNGIASSEINKIMIDLESYPEYYVENAV